MTREEFWEIVKKLVQKDYWDAQSVPPKEIKEILTKSILIPKAKFRKGDKVKWRGKKVYSIIEERIYNPEANIWAYLLNDMETYINELYLKLVERKEDETN